MNSIPGIFNDVIGPVMGGPTNYHCTSALCIGGKFTEGLIGVYITKNTTFAWLKQVQQEEWQQLL